MQSKITHNIYIYVHLVVDSIRFRERKKALVKEVPVKRILCPCVSKRILFVINSHWIDEQSFEIISKSLESEKK